MHKHLPRHRTRFGGFTLLELVIAMVIGAILVAVALPAFMGSIRKGRRSEAMTALTALQQEEERWRSNNQTYTATLGSSGLRVTSPSSPGGYYTLAISGNSETGYTAVADGTASSQAGDGECAKLAVKVDRGAISYAACRSCADSSLVFAATNTCWSR